MKQSNSAFPLLVVFGVVVVAILLVVVMKEPANVPNGVSDGPITIDGDDMPVCTLEAKLCPDGSAVGRTGPNCEFAPCPGAY